MQKAPHNSMREGWGTGEDDERTKAFTAEARRTQSKCQTAKMFWSSTPFVRPTIRGSVAIE